MTFYDFVVLDKDKTPVPLIAYHDKVVLVVNSATRSTFTGFYRGLEDLYQKYRQEGFAILDFPCNQFHGEAPEPIEEIDDWVRQEYHTTFDRFDKVDVNGVNANPLFSYLKQKLPFKGFDKGNIMSPLLSTLQVKENPGWEKSPDIKWNFTMFLVDRHGKPVHRFEPTTDIRKVDQAIYRILQKQLPEENF